MPKLNRQAAVEPAQHLDTDPGGSEIFHSAAADHNAPSRAARRRFDRPYRFPRSPNGISFVEVSERSHRPVSTILRRICFWNEPYILSILPAHVRRTISRL